MGYTSYFDFKPKTGVDYKELSVKVLSEISTAISKLPKVITTAQQTYSGKLKLAGWNGRGKPIFTTEEIRFNGDRTKDLDHETFAFEFSGEPYHAFCKTARKPYDFMVCICLLSLANNLPGFTFESDGGMEDWQPAIDFYKEVIGELNFNIEL